MMADYDVTKFDQVTMQPIRRIFTHLTYMQDKKEYDKQQFRQQL